MIIPGILVARSEYFYSMLFANVWLEVFNQVLRLSIGKYLMFLFVAAIIRQTYSDAIFWPHFGDIFKLHVKILHNFFSYKFELIIIYVFLDTKITLLICLSVISMSYRKYWQ